MSADPAQPGLLFLGGASPLGSSLDVARLVLEQAQSRGFRTHLTNSAAVLAHTMSVTAMANTVSELDPELPDECVRWSRERLAAGERFDVVLGLRDAVLLAAAEVAVVFGARANSRAAVSGVRLKDRCRATLAAAGFRQPGVRLCADLDDAIAFLRSSVGPWVVKPRDGTASMGVQKIWGVSDLARAMAGLADQSVFLVEEFVDGREFSAEGVFIDGVPTVLAVTAKQTLPPPHFVEIGHVLPAELEDAVREEIELTTGAALIALGLDFGVFHAELWLTDDGIVMGEVHPRPGGDWLHVLLSHAIPDLELFGLVFDDVLGRPPACDLTPTRAAAARFLAPKPGRLLRVNGWEAVLAHPAVLHAELNVAIGAELGPVRQSGDRAGVVVVGADNPALARELAEELAASVQFVIR